MNNTPYVHIITDAVTGEDTVIPMTADEVSALQTSPASIDPDPVDSMMVAEALRERYGWSETDVNQLFTAASQL
jgi:hypothetical protein